MSDVLPEIPDFFQKVGDLSILKLDRAALAGVALRLRSVSTEDKKGQTRKLALNTSQRILQNLTLDLRVFDQFVPTEIFERVIAAQRASH